MWRGNMWRVSLLQLNFYTKKICLSIICLLAAAWSARVWVCVLWLVGSTDQVILWAEIQTSIRSQKNKLKYENITCLKSKDLFQTLCSGSLKWLEKVFFFWGKTVFLAGSHFLTDWLAHYEGKYNDSTVWVKNDSHCSCDRLLFSPTIHQFVIGLNNNSVISLFPLCVENTN